MGPPPRGGPEPRPPLAVAGLALLVAGVLGLAAGVPGLATAADILTSFFNVQTADENVLEIFCFFSLSPFNQILDGVVVFADSRFGLSE